jgi:hypothetical protein
MENALPVRKEFDIRAPSAPQLELRLHWFGRALEARSGYIVRVSRRRLEGEHVASIAYEMPLPRYGRRPRPSGGEADAGAGARAGGATPRRARDARAG